MWLCFHSEVSVLLGGRLLIHALGEGVRLAVAHGATFTPVAPRATAKREMTRRVRDCPPNYQNNLADTNP